MGKSTLVQVARLIMRDIVEVDKISHVNQISQTINAQSVFIKSSDEYQFLSRAGFKSFWVTNWEKCNEQTKIVIREHQLP